MILMVVLIGGAGGVGKTLMAQRLLESYKIPYLSIDHLKMGICRTHLCEFSPEDSDEMIGEQLWPILRGIILTNIENHQNMIIEGCYLLPDKINTLGDNILQQILYFGVGFSESYIRNNFTSGILRHWRDIEARGYDLNPTVEETLANHKTQKERYTKHNAFYFEIEQNYEHELDKVYQWVDKHMISLKN
jgi:putative acetyltransferase